MFIAITAVKSRDFAESDDGGVILPACNYFWNDSQRICNMAGKKKNSKSMGYFPSS